MQNNHQITTIAQATQENTNALKKIPLKDFNETTNEPISPNNNYEMDF